jgi:hypothetical protein
LISHVLKYSLRQPGQGSWNGTTTTGHLGQFILDKTDVGQIDENMTAKTERGGGVKRAVDKKAGEGQLGPESR